MCLRWSFAFEHGKSPFNRDLGEYVWLFPTTLSKSFEPRGTMCIAMLAIVVQKWKLESLQMQAFRQIQLEFVHHWNPLQSEPPPVINGVITPINGLMGWFHPTCRSYNPIYSWFLGPRVLPSRPLVDSHCVPPRSKQKAKNTSSEEVPRGCLRLLYRGQLSYPFRGNQRTLVQMYGWILKDFPSNNAWRLGW